MSGLVLSSLDARDDYQQRRNVCYSEHLFAVTTRYEGEVAHEFHRWQSTAQHEEKQICAFSPTN